MFWVIIISLWGFNGSAQDLQDISVKGDFEICQMGYFSKQQSKVETFRYQGIVDRIHTYYAELGKNVQAVIRHNEGESFTEAGDEVCTARKFTLEIIVDGQKTILSDHDLAMKMDQIKSEKKLFNEFVEATGGGIEAGQLQINCFFGF